MSSSSFRNIRPSNSSNPPTGHSTSTETRRVRSDNDVEGNATSKRRRVPESVTRNACVPCQKARAKCDGKHPCKRCASRNESPDCHYEVHIKHAKEELVTQIKELRAKYHLTEQILHALSNDENIPEILKHLKRHETYENIVEMLGRPSIEEVETLSPMESQNSAFESSDHEMGGLSSTTIRWTAVTSNDIILEDLFQLYFSWVQPVHTIFNEGLFCRSYKERTDEYCSPVLVNAICAMACHLHSSVGSDEIDFERLEERFNEAARADLKSDDTRITTAQAFAVMFLVDCARGNVLRAAAYLKAAADTLSIISPVGNQESAEVKKNTVHAIHNLNVEWAHATFQVPPIIISTPFDDVEDNDNILDNSTGDYHHQNANVDPTHFHSLLAITNREKSKLIDIINDAVTMMYSQQGAKLIANEVLHLYSRYDNWRRELPASIGMAESDASQRPPHVLSLLILHSSAVVQLLRPLMDYDGFPCTLVEETVFDTAQEGLVLFHEHYRALYTCRYQPVLQAFGLLQLTDVICRFFPNGGDESRMGGAAALQFGAEALHEFSPGFPIARPLQAMLRRTAMECSIALPDNLADFPAPPHHPKENYGIDDFIDACTRPSYAQPVGEVHKRYLESFSIDWASNGGPYGFRESSSGRRMRGPSAEERGAQSLMQIRNLLNG